MYTAILLDTDDYGWTSGGFGCDETNRLIFKHTNTGRMSCYKYTRDGIFTMPSVDIAGSVGSSSSDLLSRSIDVSRKLFFIGAGVWSGDRSGIASWGYTEAGVIAEKYRRVSGDIYDITMPACDPSHRLLICGGGSMSGSSTWVYNDNGTYVVNDWHGDVGTALNSPVIDPTYHLSFSASGVSSPRTLKSSRYLQDEFSKWMLQNIATSASYSYGGMHEIDTDYKFIIFTRYNASPYQNAQVRFLSYNTDGTFGAFGSVLTMPPGAPYGTSLSFSVDTTNKLLIFTGRFNDTRIYVYKYYPDKTVELVATSELGGTGSNIPYALSVRDGLFFTLRPTTPGRLGSYRMYYPTTTPEPEPESKYIDFIIDSGAVYMNYGEANEVCIGATSGGNVFKVDTTYLDQSRDGAAGSVKGGRIAVRVVPRITANVIEFTEDFLKLLFPGSDITTISDIHTIARNAEIQLSDYIDNVTLVGEIFGRHQPIVCGVKNALVDGGVNISTSPNGEPVAEIQFTGHFETAADTEDPWFLRWPRG